MAKSKSLCRKVSKYSQQNNKVESLQIEDKLKGALKEKIKLKKTKKDLEIGAKKCTQHFEKFIQKKTPKRKLKIQL